MARSDICNELLTRAMRSEDGRATSSELGLCNTEIDWLVNAGYIEIEKYYTQGALYRITERGKRFMSQ